MTCPIAPRVVLYVRLSKESATSTSIAGQSDDLTLLAERSGWDVVAIYTDNGKSGGKERANAQAAFDLWARGDADYLVVYAYDRWSRMGIKTLAALIDVVDARARDARPAVFIAVREGIESTQQDWQLRAAFAADMAKRERDLVSARQTAARARMRNQGRNAGHGTPPFGYRTGPHPSLPVGRGFHVVEEERAIIREVAERIIANESLVRIAKDLTKRGIPTAKSAARRAALAADRRDRGETPSESEAELLDVDAASRDRGRWTLGRIRSTWTSDHLLGRVSHNGEPVYGPDGAPLAPFEPILTLSAAMAIRQRFEATKRGAQPLRRASALLSGVAYCSGCDARLYPKETGGKPGRRYVSYSCSASGRGLSCPRPVSMSARKLEREVEARYLGVMGNVPEVRTVERFEDSAAELVDLEARLKELNARALEAEDEDDEDDIRALMAPLKARRRSLRNATPTRVAEVVPTGRTYGQAWEDGGDNAKRSLLLDALDHVSVLPATAAERVVFHWQDAPEVEG
ncbi:recombinase family protein [Microbacterium sp. BWT-B31]|uniref:recombinase family protein n=1 Tax=Microbacterium sp. BWT-B31 TaxID=3232072 RepID=UPI0035288DC3